MYQVHRGNKIIKHLTNIFSSTYTIFLSKYIRNIQLC